MIEDPDRQALSNTDDKILRRGVLLLVFVSKRSDSEVRLGSGLGSKMMDDADILSGIVTSMAVAATISGESALEIMFEEDSFL